MSNITVASKNQTLSLHLIGNDSTKNFSREGSYGDWSANEAKFRELVNSLANNGWLKNESIHIMPIEEGFDYKEEIEKRTLYYTDLEVKPFKVPTGEFVENDEGELKAVIEGIEISSSQLVEAYKSMIKGKKVQYRQLDGYRRLLAIPFANAIRAQLGKEPISEIPVVKFERELTVNEQLTLCVQENTLGTLGNSPISDIDRLCICRKMVQVGDFTGVSTEAKLKKLFGEQGIGRTMVQKLANIIDLDSLHPMADIFKILRENPKNLKLVNKECMRPMFKKPLKAGEDWEPATIEEVIAYFLDPKSKEGTPKKKAVSGATMEDGANKAKVEAFKELLEGGANGDVGSTIAKYNENAILINHAIDIIMSGDTEHAVFIALNEYAEQKHAELLANA